MKVLFIGDVFGEPGISALEKHLVKIIRKHKIDFTIAQAENVSGRKGLIEKDYLRLKAAGVDAFTIGNHVWAKDGIFSIIENDDIIRPYNISKGYPGMGTRVFKVKGKTIRVTSLLGQEFNELRGGWKENKASSFFKAFDKIDSKSNSDYHIVDFHAEVTSEKNVFGLYADGRATGVFGTHTHVQTNDARVLPKGTAYITDAGMTGPINSAIGADYESVLKKMKDNKASRFVTSTNPVDLNGVILKINKDDTTEITAINKALR